MPTMTTMLRLSGALSVTILMAGFAVAASANDIQQPSSGSQVTSIPAEPSIDGGQSDAIYGVEPGTAEDVAQAWRSRGFTAVALDNYVVVSGMPERATAAVRALEEDPRVGDRVPNGRAVSAEWFEPSDLFAPGDGTPESWNTALTQINAHQWHNAGGNGSGVKVAVIDLGFMFWSEMVQFGYLPSSMVRKNFCTGPGSTFEDDPHGTAVAEMVHNVAPEARLALVCVQYTSELATAVDWVIANDYDVIQMSLNWYGMDSRGDGTGPLADIAAKAEAAGVVWVNSAANAADAHYGGTYDPGAGGYHEWVGTDQANTVTVDDWGALFHVRWDDSFDTADEYELCWREHGSVVPPPADQCGDFRDQYAAWWNANNTGPVQYPAYTWLWVPWDLFDEPTEIDLWLERKEGTVDRVVTVTRDPDGWGMERSNGVSSIMAPADVETVIAVGAYDYHNSVITSYSSRGPTLDGRVKPDLIAPSHLPSAIYEEPWGFTGTSAASPVVAGVAANMIGSGYASLLDTVQFRDLLLSDFVVGTGFSPTGDPNRSGEGRVRLISNPQPFTDVHIKNQFISDIRWLVNAGVTTGYPDNTFNPTGQVSRQAMSAFLYRFADEPEYTGAPEFSDVPESHPFSHEIGWLAASGISTGYEDGTFRPGAQVSRMAMAAFLYRFVGEPEFTPPGTPSFSDVPSTHPFFHEVEWLRSTGITTGFTDGTFRPSGNVSRQAMAAFLRRLEGLIL